jgi:hypothetical protein
MMPRISFPSPVSGLGHFNQALMGHSCQAPKRAVVAGHFQRQNRQKCGRFISALTLKISVKHLHRYFSELQFRRITRNTLACAALIIGSPLPYAKLIESIDEQPNARPEAKLGGEVL